MTEKDKQLLLKDLCARLPYGVYVLVHDTFEYSTVPYENVYLKSSDISSLIDSISLNERYNSKDKRFNRIIKEHKDFLEFKPYLRSMSSMTEKEQKEFGNLVGLWKYKGTSRFANCLPNLSGEFGKTLITEVTTAKAIDWLNKKGFDYRGLIPMGLALEATEGMYK